MLMRVHAIETGIACIRERQLVGKEPFRQLRTLAGKWVIVPMRAWLVEHPQGLVLVDTGQTARVHEPGYLPRENLYYRRALRMRVRREDELGPQLRALGFDPADIRWTILTHLHTDHAGGLEHVLRSEVVVSETEYALARGLRGRLRGYLPHRWPTGFAPRLVELPERPYGPFPRSLELTDGVHLVDTAGHTPGHMSVVVEGEPRLFFTGDACYSDELLHRDQVDGIATDAAQARATLSRMRALVGERETIVLPTHDPHAPARLARYRDQNRRFAPRVAQAAQRDALEPDQVAGTERTRRA